MTLGQRIAQYRKAAGLSQETLGERVGVSRQAVSKWETDAAAPDMENLIALARIFGVSLAELTETPEPPGNTAGPVRPPAGAAAPVAVSGLPAGAGPHNDGNLSLEQPECGPLGGGSG